MEKSVAKEIGWANDPSQVRFSFSSQHFLAVLGVLLCAAGLLGALFFAWCYAAFSKQAFSFIGLCLCVGIIGIAMVIRFDRAKPKSGNPSS